MLHAACCSRRGTVSGMSSANRKCFSDFGHRINGVCIEWLVDHLAPRTLLYRTRARKEMPFNSILKSLELAS